MSTTIDTIAMSDLPAIGDELYNGVFAGVISSKNGKESEPCAIVILRSTNMNLVWREASEWARQQGGRLPSSSQSALICDNIHKFMSSGFFWTGTVYGPSEAYMVDFQGGQILRGKCAHPRRAMAVRAIPVRGAE